MEELTKEQAKELAERLAERLNSDWTSFFNEREKAEMFFSELYGEFFRHGTDGHNRLLLLARLIHLVDTCWEVMTPEQREAVGEVYGT